MNGYLRIAILISILLAAGLAAWLAVEFKRVSGPTVYGATFSPAYARFLGLDANEVLVAALDELNLRQIRLPLHWDEVQKSADTYDFAEIDSIMDTAARRNVQVILAIGNKVPRWPECYTPGWVKALPADEYEQALLTYVEALVFRYRTHPALYRWQVENEVLFPFGDCPEVDYLLVKREIALVRSLDNAHPIQLTVSGEQQPWVSVASEADVIGTSMYRRVALPNGLLFTFPIPPRLYTLQALSVALFVDKVVISELQVEPWLTRDYREYSLAEARLLFTPQQLESYLGYARASGLQEISLWGIEWWYYLKQQGAPELWEAGRNLLK